MHVSSEYFSRELVHAVRERELAATVYTVLLFISSVVDVGYLWRIVGL